MTTAARTAGPARSGRGSGPAPTLGVERGLLDAGHRLVAGVDEVGRGALAGPVSVGVVLVDAGVAAVPRGLRDSKLLAPAARERLAPRVRAWAVASAVGHAEPEEVDAVGIIGALQTAAWRALAALPAVPDAVVLDGSHDWLSRPHPRPGAHPAVTTRVKADVACAAVAGASVLAKTVRDALMVRLAAAHPGYGWAGNKGYAAPGHREALLRDGPCAHHRLSWQLPVPAGGTAVSRGDVAGCGCMMGSMSSGSVPDEARRERR